MRSTLLVLILCSWLSTAYADLNLKEVISFSKYQVANSCFGPDGKYLLINRTGMTAVIDVSTSKETKTLDMGLSCVFSPDKKYMAGTRESGALVPIYETANWTEVAVIKNSGAQAIFSPNGKYLGVHQVGTGGETVIYDIASWKEIQRIGRVSDEFLGFSPDGEQILVQDIKSDSSGHYSLRFINVLSKQGTKVISAPSGKAFSKILFSPDGKFLIGEGYNHNLMIFDTLSGTLVRTLNELTDSHAWSFSPDGKLFFSSGEGIAVNNTVYSTATWQEVFSFKVGGISQAVFSPDSGTLAVIGRNNMTRLFIVFDTVTWKEDKISFAPGSNYEFHELLLNNEAFSTDSRFLTLSYRVRQSDHGYYIRGSNMVYEILR